jgi:hypothetical protein
MVRIILLTSLMAGICGCTTNRIVIVGNNCGIEFFVNTKQLRPADSLVLVVKNNNNSQVEVSNFSCYANTHIDLEDSFGNRVSQYAKIHADLSCREEFTLVGRGEKKIFTYGYTIAALYNVVPNKRYKMNITYDGFVKINNRKNKCSNIVFSDWVTFTE